MWFFNFLSDQSQFVRVHGGCSSVITVISGVPQRTDLASLLFLILMTDISTNVTSLIVSFVDDTRLCLGIRKAFDLQDDLNTVYSWVNGNNMKFNKNKLQVAFSTTVPLVPSLDPR